MSGLKNGVSPAGVPAPPAVSSARVVPSGNAWPLDALAGLAAMLVALPSAIGFGVAIYSFAGPQFVPQGALAGIIGAALVGLVAALFGGTPRMISAPSGPSAAVLAGLAGVFAGQNSIVPVDSIPLVLIIVSLLAGLFQMAYGALGGGKLIKFIPYPVVAGYLNAVGVLIIATQLPRIPGVAGNPWGLLQPQHWNWAGVLIGCATILAVALAPRLMKGFPAPVLGLAAGLICYFVLAAAGSTPLSLENNALVLGPVGGGIDQIRHGLSAYWRAAQSLDPGLLRVLVVPAFTLSLLLSIDTLKTCVIVDAMTRSRHDSNRELLAQGAGNMLSAAFGGLPGAGTTGPTLVNLNSGARTRWSGVVEALAVVLAFLLLRRWIAWIPIPALAGILIVLSWRMFDWRIFHLLRSRSTVLDFCVIATVVLVALTVGLVPAAGAGLALAVLLFLREQIRTPVVRWKVDGSGISSKRRRSEDEVELLKRCGAETLVCELQGSLFFGTTDRLFTELEPDLKHCRCLVLDMRRVHSVDFTAARMLEQIRGLLHEHGGSLLFSSVPASLPTGRNLRKYLQDLRLLAPSANVRFFDALDEAVEWAEDQLLGRERASVRTPEKPLDLLEFDLFRAGGLDEAANSLATHFAQRQVPRGTILFREGDAGDDLLLIRRGTVRVQLSLGGSRSYSLAYFDRGSFIGEMSFLDGARRSAEAVAVTDVELFVLSRKSFDALARENPQAALTIFGEMARALAVRLRYADAELRALHEM